MGIEERPKRWERCITDLEETMEFGLASLYVREALTDEGKILVRLLSLLVAFLICMSPTLFHISYKLNKICKHFMLIRKMTILFFPTGNRDCSKHHQRISKKSCQC